MIIFVGQAPGHPKRSEQTEIPGAPPPLDLGPLSGVAGRRLCKILGIRFERFLMCRRENMNARFPGKAGKGDAFDIQEGMEQAKSLRARVRPGDLVVLLGRNVTRCFGLKWVPFRIGSLSAATYVILSHPSGVN
jgi:uracil-DNA glycosylase